MKLSKKILISFTLGLCINPAFADQNFFNAIEPETDLMFTTSHLENSLG